MVGVLLIGLTLVAIAAEVVLRALDLPKEHRVSLVTMLLKRDSGGPESR